MSKSYIDDRFWEIGNPEIGVFRDYLDSMEEFLQAEIQKHTDSMDDLNEKIKLGEINPPEDQEQFPPELEYDYYRLSAMDYFANILRKSFFVSLYSFLESELMRRCHHLERRKAGITLSVSDIAGKGINQAMTYLIKVHNINFSPSTSLEWSEIQNYRKLRNCVVHNEGILNEGTEQRRQLEAYIKSNRNLSFSIHLNGIILGKDFCTEAIETIAKFLYAIDSTML